MQYNERFSTNYSIFTPLTFTTYNWFRIWYFSENPDRRFRQAIQKHWMRLFTIQVLTERIAEEQLVTATRHWPFSLISMKLLLSQQIIGRILRSNNGKRAKPHTEMAIRFWRDSRVIIDRFLLPLDFFRNIQTVLIV